MNETIEKLNIEGKSVLAPMAGYTDSPFRKIARQYGAAIVYTELISANGIVRGNSKTLELLKFSEEERPIGIQIFGSEPSMMGEAAQKVMELKPDIIDINMGCCAKKVCKNGSGAAILLDQNHIAAIAKKVCDSVPVPVTAKIRIGWDHSSLNYLDTVRTLEDSGISLISVHGRTKAQRYTETSNWDIIREIRENASVPIIGNGDILSYDEAAKRLESSGCYAVMIGRGAVGNPWIFSGEKPGTHDLIQQIKTHLEQMLEFYGDKGIILMRKHIVKYIHGIRNASKIRTTLLTSKTRDEVFEKLDELISE